VVPISTYAHVKKGACAVIGGAFLENWYLFADYCDGILRSLPLDAAAGTKAAQIYDFNRDSKQVGVVAVVSDVFGRVWVLDAWGGNVFQIEATP